MKRYPFLVPTAAFILAIHGCGDDDSASGPGGGTDGGATVDSSSGGADAGDGGTVRRAAPLPSHGSSVALSPDDTRLVVANREAGTVSVFGVDWSKGARPELTRLGEVAVGGEVSQVAVHPSGEFALALSRIDQKLVRIDDLRSTPKVGASVKTGSEPTGLGLTPFGDTAWVANFVDGTVLSIDTAKMTVSKTVDLNATIAASGRLGAGLTGRPALAHPRSIAVTNNGNNLDDDEFVYVTDFYAHQKVAVAPDGSNADVAKAAVVYKISVKNPAEVSIIELPPMVDMGFKDHKNGAAGCFPNQLLSMNIQGAFGYVLSICASPKGPIGPFTGPGFVACADPAATTCPGNAVGSCVNSKCTTNCSIDADCGANGGKCNANVCAGNTVNIKTTVAPAVSIIDLGAAKTIATVNLSKEFESSFVTRALPDDGNRRMPLTTTDISFVPGTVTAYVASKGSDALFKIDFNATYEASTIDAVGDPKAPFIALAPAGIDPSKLGRLPTGVAVAFKTHTEGSKLRFAFVNNENTRKVWVVDLDAQDLAGGGEGTRFVARSREIDVAKEPRSSPRRASSRPTPRPSLGSRESGSSRPVSVAGRSRGKPGPRARAVTSTASLTT
jgi:DNA-binding beta-propeller fold protein YncE